MATKLKVNYEFVGDSTTPVTRTNSIKHGDKILNKVIDDMSTFVTPEMFGAKGDGVTDDSDAFIAMLSSNHSVSLVSESVYLISKTISIPSDTVVIGNNAKIKVKSNSAIENGIFGISDKHNITIANVCFDSNVSNQITYPLDDAQKFYNTPIFIYQSSDIEVENCVFDGVYSTCVKVYGCDKSIIINNCYFKTIQPSFQYGCIFIHLLSNASSCQINIHNNYLESEVTNYNYGVGGIFIASQTSFVSVKSNYFGKIGRNSSTQPLSPVDLYMNCENVIIDGNKFVKCCMLSRVCSSCNVKIINNIFDEIIATNPPTNIIVVYITSYYGTKHDCYNIDISNNIINQVSQAVKTIGISSQYNDIAPHDITICRNKMECLAGCIIILSGTRNVIISENRYNCGIGNGSFVYVTSTNTTELKPGSYTISNNDITCNTVLIANQDISENTMISNVYGNRAYCVGGFIIGIPCVISNNVLASSSQAYNQALVFNKSNDVTSFFINNIMSDRFYAHLSEDGLIASGNYYNGISH